jgi:DNA-binding IclR family transcriptional regulator
MMNLPLTEPISEEDSPKFNAIEKAIAILMSFLPHNDAVSTTDLSKSLGFHKATTSRILKIMYEHGLVRQNETTKLYSLGPSIVKLSTAVHKSLNSGVISLARPFLNELRKQTGQTVTLEILNGHQVMMGCVVEGDKSIIVAGQVGDNICWNTTAGMRSIMAFSDAEFVKEMIQQPMVALTENSIADPISYLKALTKVRQDGYAFEDGEVAIGLAALGAPVFGHDGRPLFGVCMVGIGDVLKRDQAMYASALKDTVKKISKTFMYNE